MDLHPALSRPGTALRLFLAGLAAACITLPRAAAAATTARITRSFDRDWRFLQSAAPGAEKPGFVDSDWQQVRVPHDWSILGPFNKNNPTGAAGGFLPAGIGWYRKHFTLPATDRGRRVFIDFDGIMANSDVWINGHHLGHRPYGYVSFGYELTDYLHFGAGTSNVLAVRVDDSRQPASRWYEGAGIYRHVHLVITAPVHIKHWGTFVTTPEVTAGRATVQVRSAVVNESTAPSTVSLQVTLHGPDGAPAGTADAPPQTIAPGKSADFNVTIAVPSPKLWDLDHPAMYRAVAEVRAGGTTIDDQTVPFGIRDARFKAATGFWLNGRNLKIKGVCLHDDASAFGMAVPLGAWVRRLTALKRLGVNAIRTAHNPPAPEFLDLCDRMGFLVMDEMFDCWTVGKNPYDYHLYFRQWSKTDVRDTVRRDRNHPSIILYSAGNEIHDTPHAELAKGILAGLLKVFHRYDPTRPVTMALLRPNRSHDYTDGLAAMLGVVGTNYRYTELIAAHRANPSWKIIGTENKHDLASWLAVRDTPFYSGEFIWSGADYLGEAWFWPNVAAGAGLVDRTDVPKPDGYKFKSWWSSRPMVYAVRRVAPTPLGPKDPGYGKFHFRRRFPFLYPDWTPKNEGPHEENVEVYSNCDQVELVLNGRSLGVKDRPADLAARNWKVAFQPGTLRAIGRDHGKIVAEYVLRTAGKPARIELSAAASRLAPDWNDVDFVTAKVVDKNGTVVPGADNLISFQVSGPGRIAATDSANNQSHESFQAPRRRAYHGRCVAIVRATAPTGRITLSASAPGLKGASVEIQAIPVAKRE